MQKLGKIFDNNPEIKGFQHEMTASFLHPAIEKWGGRNKKTVIPGLTRNPERNTEIFRSTFLCLAYGSGFRLSPE
jgi:hypothetical protein